MTTPASAPRAARPAPKPSQKKAAAAKPAKAAAKPAKAPAAKKTAVKTTEGGVVRAQSTISKEGTQRCEFSGETLPVTAFPTVRKSDGTYVRGTVARKHLQASRDAKRAAREAAKAAAASKKATAPAKPKG